MRSKSLVSAAIAFAAICSWLAPRAHATDHKNKAAPAADKKKAAELHADEKSMKKQFNWEDKVMGPDDKRAELEKIARAHAINEKAEKEKERQAAIEAAAPPPPAAKPAKKQEVALPSTAPEEKPSATPHEISPKLATEAARAPVPATKPADDKFIDKLLKEEGGPKKKRASTSEDKALVDMLATEKPAIKGAAKKGKKDGVDDLLTDADKAAPMPETKVKHETPEWAKPEIRESAPAPKVVAAPKQDKPNDGIIRVVQGAVGTSSSSGSARPAVATSTRTPPPPAGAGVRKQTAAVNSKPGEWADPFSDPTSRKNSSKTVAAKRPVLDDDDDIKPAPRKTTAAAPAKANRSGGGAWDDPFSDGDRKTTGTRRAATPAAEPAKPTKAAPARRGGGGKWDDPFTSDQAPAAKPARSVVAAREPVAAKKKVAAAPAAAPAKAAVADDSDSQKAQGRWGILKKRR
jgi:hypothetical protein